MESKLKVVEIEPTNWCNLKCKMCHVRFMNKQNFIKFDLSLIKHLEGLHDCVINIGATFEPTLHKDLHQIINFFSNNNNQIILTTNATNISSNLFKAINDSKNFYAIYFSFDSIIKETYEKIRINGNFEKVVKNITEISKICANKQTKTIINMVLMKSNLNEIFDMVEFCEENKIDKLNLIVMTIRKDIDDIINESLYSIRDKLYLLLDEVAEYVIKKRLNLVVSSPYYFYTKLREKYPNNFYKNTVFYSKDKYIPNIKNERQILVLKNNIKCISPYTFARILWNGSVELCYNFKIGNLKDDNLKKIFNNLNASNIRKNLEKDNIFCKKCAYYKFCLLSYKIDLNDKKMYYQ